MVPKHSWDLALESPCVPAGRGEGGGRWQPWQAFQQPCGLVRCSGRSLQKEAGAPSLWSLSFIISNRRASGAGAQKEVMAMGKELQ